MGVSLMLFIALHCLIVSAYSTSGESCHTVCGLKKCNWGQFCQVKYAQECNEDPVAPVHECINADYATYKVEIKRCQGICLKSTEPFFYRTDTFSDCKEGHKRILTWKWPAQLVKHSWIFPYLDSFLRHYEGSKNEMYMWKECQCGMVACPERFRIGVPTQALGLQAGTHELSYEFSCRKQCDPLTTKAVEAKFIKTNHGTKDTERTPGHPFAPPKPGFCTKNASPAPTLRTTPPESQVTCSGINTAPGLLVSFVLAAAFLLR